MVDYFYYKPFSKHITLVSGNIHPFSKIEIETCISKKVIQLCRKYSHAPTSTSNQFNIVT